MSNVMEKKTEIKHYIGEILKRYEFANYIVHEEFAEVLDIVPP